MLQRVYALILHVPQHINVVAVEQVILHVMRRFDTRLHGLYGTRCSGFSAPLCATACTPTHARPREQELEIAEARLCGASARSPIKSRFARVESHSIGV